MNWLEGDQVALVSIQVGDKYLEDWSETILVCSKDVLNVKTVI